MSISREQVVLGVLLYPSFGDFGPIMIDILDLYETFKEIEIVFTLKTDRQAM